MVTRKLARQEAALSQVNAGFASVAKARSQQDWSDRTIFMALWRNAIPQLHCFIRFPAVNSLLNGPVVKALYM